MEILVKKADGIRFAFAIGYDPYNDGNPWAPEHVGIYAVGGASVLSTLEVGLYDVQFAKDCVISPCDDGYTNAIEYVTIIGEVDSITKID